MTHDNVLNFGIHCTRKNKIAGEKRTASLEIIDTIHVFKSSQFSQLGMNESDQNESWFKNIIKRLLKI